MQSIRPTHAPTWLPFVDIVMHFVPAPAATHSASAVQIVINPAQLAEHFVPGNLEPASQADPSSAER